MKNLKLFAVGLFVATLMLGSCGPKSVKGKWTDGDKEALKKELSSNPDMAKLGDKLNPFIDCYMAKVEATFDGIEALAKDVAGNTKISEDCTKEVIGVQVQDTTVTTNDSTVVK